MNKTLNALLLVLVPSAILHAAPSVVKLSGTVSRTGGAALAGVNFTLKGAPGVTATSSANGAFLLSMGSTIVGPRASRGAVRMELDESGKALHFLSTTESVTGALEILSAGGRWIHAEDLSAWGARMRRLPVSSFAPGINLVRLRTEGEVVSASVLRVDDRLFLKSGSTASVSSSASVLGRSAAAAVDTLIATKTGFVEKRTPIASYIDSNLAIAMDSIGSGTCTPPKAGTSKSNPIFTDVYTADPGVMVDNCTFYIQCGHDQGTGGFDLREWYLLKSTDMVNWTRTTPMTLKIFSWTNANAWAGQMIKGRNGKFYWYVPINDIRYSADRMAIGVAVADSPEGPWKDALGKPLVNDSLEMSTWNITNIDQTPHTIDPTVFIDDDGQAYLQYGGFWTMVTVKLNPDMISISGKLAKTTPPDYFESPYLVKRNNLYYEIYAHGAANPTTIDYATSTSPMGPWTHKGTILAQMPKVAGQDETTNHAGVAEFAGQWYIVYHVSNGPNGGGTYRREVAIDKMFFNSDGTIKPVTPSPSLTF